MDTRGERLQKVLAHAGVGSRRAVEGLIAAGRVRVNGTVAELGRRVDEAKDVVEVDGSRVPLNPRLVYYLVNKPAGVVSTASDPEGRQTVLDLLDTSDRVWTVGRLDVDTEGAIIVTNDGELTHRLTHPSFGAAKTYLAEVTGAVRRRDVVRLGAGIELDDGPTAPADVTVLEGRSSTSLVEVTISEGRKRQVRRMFESIGHPVVRLARVAVGPVRLGRLRPGTARRLLPAEVAALWKETGGNPTSGVQ